MTAETERRGTTRGDGTWTGDVIVIGAGIVGLAAAREILKRHPDLKLAVLEKEAQIAGHQSGHNSGVIHSGIYYAPGSLKAKACVAGSAQMMAYCDEHDIPYQLCGKVIVATDESEIPRLEALFERGQTNGVPDLRMIDADELKEVEPHVTGVHAILSPRTGIVDYRQVADSYAEELMKSGGKILTDHEVVSIIRGATRTLVCTNRGDFETKRVIACAGVYADRVAGMTGAPLEPRIVPFRGDYYILRPERRDLVRGNIYPVPDPRFPFLGVHFTPRMNGDLWLGPNAVLAFSREGYSFGSIQLNDLTDMARFGGFRNFARKHWRTGFDEMARDLSKKRFLASLQKFIPELEMEDLLPGPSGVRAQALSEDGNLVDDFIVDRERRVLHVRNAPSPAATSSLVIGAMIADAFDQMD
ncbi:MAG: L-2-hydroxyglutarate oxidase [Nitrolancea sp.]